MGFAMIFLLLFIILKIKTKQKNNRKEKYEKIRRGRAQVHFSSAPLVQLRLFSEMGMLLEGYAFILSVC